jgi:hypothetical protein
VAVLCVRRLALDLLLDEFPDTFTLVQYHINDSYATTGNLARQLYGVSGTPVAWFDGTLQCPGPTPTRNSNTTGI